jgi:hypothetical protein
MVIVTVAVLAELAEAEPKELVAVTTQRSVLPISAFWIVYELLVAPEILDVLRCHWYAYVMGAVPVQVPVEEERVCPKEAVPEMAGITVLTGAAPPAPLTLANTPCRIPVILS